MTHGSPMIDATLKAAEFALAEAARLSSDGEADAAERFARLAEKLAGAGARVASLHDATRSPHALEDPNDSMEAALGRVYARLDAIARVIREDALDELAAIGWVDPCDADR